MAFTRAGSDPGRGGGARRESLYDQRWETGDEWAGVRKVKAVTSTPASRNVRTQAAVAGQALARLRAHVIALAQMVADADLPPFPIAEVQAILDERGTTGETDPRYGVLVATAQRWAAGLTACLHRDTAYRTLLSAYQRYQTADHVLQVAVEAGGLGCDLTIALPLELARQARAADGSEQGPAVAHAAAGNGR